MKPSALGDELRLGLLNGLICHAGIVIATWIQYWRSGMVDRFPSLSTAAVGLVLGSAIVFGWNAKRSPRRLWFALVRTLAHVLFGGAAPIAGLLLGLLAAPHGINALPRVGKPLCILIAAATVGAVMLRWVVARNKNPHPH